MMSPPLDQLVERHRVHRALYTDPAIFELEMTRVFAASWCFVGHRSQLANAGDFVVTTLGRRSVIVTLGPDGSIHALLNRCTHRGTELVTQVAGCAKRFTCPYHGWTFAGDGRLVAMPYPDNHRDPDDPELALGTAQCAEYRGFIFATLAADPPRLEDWLGAARDAFDELVDRHPGGALRVARSAQRIEFRGNWKLSWDNAADGLHATFAHRSYNRLGSNDDVDTVLARDPASTPMTAKGTRYGHMVVDQRPGLASGQWASIRPVPFAESFAGEVLEAGSADSAARPALLDLGAGSMLNLSLFPNLIFVGNQLLVVEPIAVDRTRMVLHLVFADDAPDAVNQLRLRADEDFVSFGTPDDLDMFERVQRGLSIPEVEWIDVGRGLDDPIDEDGTSVGPITSEAPQRAYLRRYDELLRAEPTLRARRPIDARHG